MTDRPATDGRPPRRDRTVALAVAFGLVSIPWTYAFVAADVPLWPSFVAAATFYAAGGGSDGLARGSASNLAGVLYGAATLAIVGGVGGGPIVLAVVVGAFMFLASLHPLVRPLSFAPGGFFGYATMFGVHASGATVLVDGLAGEAAAAGGAMLVGAIVGFATERASERLSRAAT